MISSLFEVAGAQLFPYPMATPEVSTYINEAFPEIKTAFGKDATAMMEITIDTNEKDPIKVSAKEGLVIGGSQVKATVSLLASNKTAKNQTAATFSMDFEMHANSTIQAFVAYPDIKSIYAQNVKVVKDNIKLGAHQYNLVFTALFEHMTSDFNKQYSAGYPLANIDPTIGMLSGLLNNMTVSPYYADGFMYAGFSMYADLPTLDFI